MAILVVDDNLDVAEDIASRIAYFGGEATIASTAQSALEILAQHPTEYTGAVVDVVLPDATGYDLVREIRNNNIPIECIAVTAYGSSQVEAECLKAGFDAYYAKPFDNSFMQAMKDLSE
jgi:CheY-like chemotaxis protein